MGLVSRSGPGPPRAARGRATLNLLGTSGITANLDNAGTIENAQANAGHESARDAALLQELFPETVVDEYLGRMPDL